jgi:hypothetical protein
MNFEVVGSPNHENELQEFRFKFHGETMTLTVVRFRVYQRAKETCPWDLQGEWTFPDLFHKNTLPQPELPGWAMVDAKTYIIQQLRFQ